MFSALIANVGNATKLAFYTLFGIVGCVVGAFGIYLGAEFPASPLVWMMIASGIGSFWLLMAVFAIPFLEWLQCRDYTEDFGDEPLVKLGQSSEMPEHLTKDAVFSKWFRSQPYHEARAKLDAYEEVAKLMVLMNIAYEDAVTSETGQAFDDNPIVPTPPTGEGWDKHPDDWD